MLLELQHFCSCLVWARGFLGLALGYGVLDACLEVNWDLLVWNQLDGGYATWLKCAHKRGELTRVDVLTLPWL